MCILYAGLGMEEVEAEGNASYSLRLSLAPPLPVLTG
jgi:hypothetical protein